MKKLIIGLGSLFLILIILLLGFISYHTPQYKGELTLDNLSSEVEVLFDEYGVPHIYAESEEDAYRALGYVHAQDRLFQLEMMRRVGTGTLAEMLGPELVDIDKFFRTLGIPSQSARSTESWTQEADSPWKKSTMAYIDGVNQFIKEGALPPEYSLLQHSPREFTVNDIHAITGYMAFSFAMAIKTDPILTKISRELGPEYLKSLSINTLPEHIFIPNFYPKADNSTDQESTLALLDKLPVPLLKGSNAWVISGDKTENGKVLFANDTHIGFASPSVWYEAHLEYPGFSYYGNHLAGMPFGLVGHNDFQSLGLTMFENDDQDFFEETVNPQNPDEIIIGDSTSPISRRTEIIKVKGEADVELEIAETIHGPIVNSVIPEIAEVTDKPVASWWVYLQEPSKAIEATYKMNHARSIQEVAEAAELIHAPGLNIMYGDADGNIGWWAAARLPDRNPEVSSKFFRDGSNPEHQPEGWLPFELNPQSINPSWGYVVSANNQTDTLSNGAFVPGYYYPGDRYGRIAETLEAKDDWSIESLKVLQNETVNTTHSDIANYVVGIVNMNDFNEYAEALEKVRNWEGDHEILNIAPTIYYKWLYHIYRLAMADELGQAGFEQFIGTFAMIRSYDYFIQSEDNRWWDNVQTSEEETRSQIVSDALAITLDELSEQHGEIWEQWVWASSIISVHPHPLGSQKPLDKIFNVESPTLEANAEAVNKLAFTLNGEGLYTVRSGPAMRILLDFAEIEKSESVLPTGQSGNRFSQFYKDQVNLYANGEYRGQLMDREDIEKSSDHRLVFTNPN